MPENQCMSCSRYILGLLSLLLAVSLSPFGGAACAEEFGWGILPGNRHIPARFPSQIPKPPAPDVPPPITVFQEVPPQPVWEVSLDEAIQTALRNSEVVRVLAGFAASSSGRTIYDPAISLIQIDQAKARFDPQLEMRHIFNRRENPGAIPDPTDPGNAFIGGAQRDDYDFSLGLSKVNPLGGTSRLGVLANPRDVSPAGNALLNPERPSSAELSYTQPLLQGAGPVANRAPILIARIETERSFFQLKQSVQELVRGTVEAYWGIVFARIDVWAREQQVKQGLEAVNFAEARLETGLSDAANLAQARSAYENFRASLIGSRGALLDREAGFLNLLGLPPSNPPRVVPMTPAQEGRIESQWQPLLNLAVENRPDLVELALILEADQQRLLQARNNALPRLDAVALYRWNGLEGRTPDRRLVSSEPGEFTDWQLGVNFSVPLGLRQARAGLRQQELLILRDEASLQQGIHNAVHVLATRIRNLDRFYAQYLAFQAAREAARENLKAQWARVTTGQANTNIINLLQAITDWGNAVSAEAQALTSYNTELASLELETGTILESHGIRFHEEKYGSIGPLGRIAHPALFPKSLFPGENEPRYERSDRPAEESFDLTYPAPLTEGNGAGVPRDPGRPLFQPPVRPPEGIFETLPGLNR